MTLWFNLTMSLFLSFCLAAMVFKRFSRMVSQNIACTCTVKRMTSRFNIFHWILMDKCRNPCLRYAYVTLLIQCLLIEKKTILNRYAMNILQKVVTHVPKTRVTLLFPSIEYAKLIGFWWNWLYREWTIFMCFIC